MKSARYLIGLAALLIAGTAFGQDAYQAAAKYKWGDGESALTAVEAEVRKAGPEQYPEIEAKLIELVNSDATPEAKGFACRMLRTAGSGKCVPALAKLLADEKTTHMARYALETIGDPAAGEALRTALGQTKGKVQVGIISSIGVRRDEKAIAALKDLTGDSDEAVAGAALQSLGAIGTLDAANALGNAKVADSLQRKRSAALITAAALLADAGQKRAPEAIYSAMTGRSQSQAVRVAGLKGLVGTLDQPAAVKLICEQLQGDDAVMRTATIAAYVGSSTELKKAVAEQLPQLKPQAQVALLAVLRDEPEVPARAVIVKLFTREADASTEVRLVALAALAVHGEAEDVRFLVQLASGAGAEANAAKQTLQRMGKGGVDEALVDLIASKDAKARAVVTATLGARRVESALPKLVQLVAGSDLDVAAEAAKALGMIGNPQQIGSLSDVIIATGDDALRAAASDAARSIVIRAADKAACAKTLLAALDKAKAAPARVAIIKLLPFTRDTQALVVVRVASSDASNEVSDAATRTLTDWPELSAAPFILDLAKTSTNNTYKVLAIRGAIRLGRLKEGTMSQRLSIITTAMNLSTSAQDKQQAMAALAEIPSVGALDAIVKNLKDAELSQSAAEAVSRLSRQLAFVDSKRATAALEQAKAVARTDELRGKIDDAINAVKNAAQSADGYIVAWMLSGPYVEEGKSGPQLFDVALDPEKGGGKAEWRPAMATLGGPVPKVEMDKILGGNDRVAYLRVYVISTKAQDAQLEVGSDDGVKILLNKKVVMSNNATRACAPGQDKAKIRLNSGSNELLVKITQGGGEWATCVRLVTPDGKLLDGVTVALEP